MNAVTDIPREVVDLSTWTTMGVGPTRSIWLPRTPEQIASLAAAWDADQTPWLVLGGGSNVVLGTLPEDLEVVHPDIYGIELSDGEDDTVIMSVGAGEHWDNVVAFAVEHGLGGIEALSGIPGSAGAAPVQNIGAYGTELSSVLVSIDRWRDGNVERVAAADLDLAYRSSSLKTDGDSIVIAMQLRLQRNGQSAPIGYEQLAAALGTELGTQLPVAEVRNAVLAVRRKKSMVFDPADIDSHGCGSFFTNPIVRNEFAANLSLEIPRWAMPDGHHVKLSAAWLIEHAGIGKGFSLPGSGAAVSNKHTLAITNRGAASAFDITQLAAFIQTRVQNEFGVRLQPEPQIFSE